METVIRKPEGDEREFEYAELENGLQVVYVSDPCAEKSAAALSVGVGHMCDPDDRDAALPGLAHYLEHMLFLGSEKYPDEQAYRKFLNDHGGSSNASTSSEKTTYHFEVEPSSLGGALDIFMQFFIAPLFDASCADREVHAVDSENSKNLTSNSRRQYQLIKSTSSLSYPFSHFGTGNLDTLKTRPEEAGIDVRAALIEFHQQYYSANLMTLSVVGPQSIADLKSLVHDAGADTIPSSSLDIPVFDPTAAVRVSGEDDVETTRDGVASTLVPFCDTDTSAGPSWFRMVPVSEERSLTVLIPLPGLRHAYETKVTSLLSHVMGDEGSGSLFSALRKLRWATSLSSYVYLEYWEYTVFAVRVSLTPEGYENAHGVVAAIFAAYRNLTGAEDAELERIYAEKAAISAIKFRFQERRKPRETAKSIASALHNRKPQHVLSGGFEYAPALDINLLRKHVFPWLDRKYARVYVTSKDEVPNADLIEPVYGTAYSTSSTPAELAALLDDPCGNSPVLAEVVASLTLPAPNPYIPDSFPILPGVVGKEGEDPDRLSPPAPSKLVDDQSGRLFHLRDVVYGKPKVYGRIVLRSSDSDLVSPLAKAANSVFLALLDDALTEFMYPATLVRLSVSLSSGWEGWTINFSGFSPKMGAYLVDFLTRAMDVVDLDPELFRIYQERTLRGYKSRKTESPHWHARRVFGRLTESPMVWTDADMISAVQNLTFADIQGAQARFMTQCYAEAFMYGNLDQTTARAWYAAVRETIGWKPLPISLVPEWRAVEPPRGSRVVFRSPLENEEDTNSSIVLRFLIRGAHEPSEHYATALLMQAAKQLAFDTLRTEQQLGYIVWTQSPVFAGERYLGWCIQSATHSPEVLEAAILTFVDGKLKDAIAEVANDPETLGLHKNALKLRVALRDKSMSDQYASARSILFSHKYEFDRKDLACSRIDALTGADLLRVYSQFIATPEEGAGAGASHRSMVVVKLYGNNHLEEYGVHTGGASVAEQRQAANRVGESLVCVGPGSGDVDDYVASMPLFPVRNALRRIDPLPLVP